MTLPRGAAGPDVRRVLLVRMGSLGDIVHALPALATIQENFPRWELDWLVERRWRALLEGNPCLRRIVEFDTLAWRASPLSLGTWSELRGALRGLREGRYDCAVDLQGALKSAIACRASGAREVIGFDRKWLREPAAGVLYTRRARPNAVHVVEANLALAEALGATRRVRSFPLPPGDPAALPEELRGVPLAVISPGAGWRAKQWPAGGYAALCDAIEGHRGWPVVINCGPGEEPLAREVRQACRQARPATYAGSLAGLIALLRQARLVVAPDSGPLHLAAALGVPTVALFGPTDPRRNGPYGNRHRVLRPERAVTSHRRSASATWMQQILPQQVLAAAEELLAEQDLQKEAGGAATETPSLAS